MSELLRIPDVQFVLRTSGAADIYANLFPLRGSDPHDLLTSTIPSIPGVRAIDSRMILEPAKVGQSWRYRRLDAARTAELEKHSSVADGEPLRDLEQLSDLEFETMRMLGANGRVTAAEVGRTLGVSPTTAARAMRLLIHSGAISPRIEIQPDLMGFPLNAVVTIDVRPRDIRGALDTLAAHPSVRLLSTVTGSAPVSLAGVFAGPSISPASCATTSAPSPASDRCSRSRACGSNAGTGSIATACASATPSRACCAAERNHLRSLAGRRSRDGRAQPARNRVFAAPDAEVMRSRNARTTRSSSAGVSRTAAAISVPAASRKSAVPALAADVGRRFTRRRSASPRCLSTCPARSRRSISTDTAPEVIPICRASSAGDSGCPDCSAHTMRPSASASVTGSAIHAERWRCSSSEASDQSRRPCMTATSSVDHEVESASDPVTQ